VPARPLRLPHHHLDQAAGWAALWGVPGLERRVTIRVSRRLTASLGRATPARRAIRLAAALFAGPPAFLAEVLCHELAHIAVWELHGDGARPHGREWKALMRRAGYPPSTRLTPPPGVALPAPRPRRRRRRYLYDHRCERCGWSRTARAAVRRWRCPPCSAAGGEGKLAIWRLG
jgi:predicted SprT family Zn-dependent metalloprotease